MASKYSKSSPLFTLFVVSIILLLSSSPVMAQPNSPPQSNSNTQYGYGQSNFTPSMAIVIIVLIAVFFFLGFFSVYVRQCTGDGIAGAGSAAQIPTANRRPRGLDPEIIESLPTMVYSEVKEHKVGKGALECAVCLSEFEDDETLRLLPKCSHVFHTDCIDAWLAGHVTCPVCRYNLTDYKGGEMPYPDFTTVDLNSPRERPAEIAQQVEERSVDTPALPADAVVVEVKPETEEEIREREEAEELERIAIRRRALRSKSSRRPVKFPRSHSTGHSLSSTVRTGDDPDRYTLRIPDHVLRQIIADGKLKRSTSLLFFRETGEGSSRPGYRGNGEGSNRGGRSVRMFVRNLSEKFSSWGMGRRGDGEGSVKGEGSTVRGRLGSVRVQFDCLAGGATPAGKAESGEGSVVRRV
ncbi:E3 ubiquitin-protein ligase ATL6-like protein [Carex littledalei]|uniref:RING-type E3 ubiquitin transferase n=1 Tax=Carex littledalei TaxID=544730 RepID=A0A833RHV5_9POAL|nr:E3 ubiquitin-protein ligase ATL6-like protein [Carex littledalei]